MADLLHYLTNNPGASSLRAFFQDSYLIMGQELVKRISADDSDAAELHGRQLAVFDKEL
jgi:hypothetical protein